MSGHSKWSNIKFKKAAEDEKRGKIFTKVIKEITVATRIGGKDPDDNPRLRIAIEKAKAANMPKENVQKAIKKGAGELDGTRFETVIYEGYGPAGVAILVMASTDNKNRTASAVRSTFSKLGGNLGESGCVGWMFDQKGVMVFDGKLDEDELIDKALEAGATDVEQDDNSECYYVYTDPKLLYQINGKLEKQGLKSSDTFIDEIPQTKVELSETDRLKMVKLLERLSDLDDVDDVYANCDV